MRCESSDRHHAKEIVFPDSIRAGRAIHDEFRGGHKKSESMMWSGIVEIEF